MAQSLVAAGSPAVERGGGAAHHQPRRLEVGGHVGELELQRLELAQRPAELAALGHVSAWPPRTPAGAAERAGGDVEPSAVQPHHREAEAAALVADPVGDRHAAHCRRCTIAVGWLRHPSLRSGAPKVRPGVPFSTTIAETPAGALAAGAGHDDVDIGGSGAGDERLGAVQHVIVALAPGAGLQRRGVGARAGLGQAVGGDQVHAAQRRQEALAQRLVAEAVDHPGGHVVDRQERGGRDIAAGQRLEHDRRIEPGSAEPPTSSRT